MSEPEQQPGPATWGASAATLLFVPGDRPERFEKAAAAGPDLVIVDLEDAVAPSNKEQAREQAAGWLRSASQPAGVRINAVDTPWHRADLDALAARGMPCLVMLPKADAPGVVADVLAALPGGSAVIALVETARGVARAERLATAHGVVRLALGTYDLAAELGVDPDHAPALAGARNALVMASAIAGLTGPIDGVTGAVRDPDRLHADVTASAALGFAGKLAIHPSQVAASAAALAPSAEQIAWAERVLAASATAEGGVAVIDDRMVDAPVVARARRILTRAGAGERNQ